MVTVMVLAKRMSRGSGPLSKCRKRESMLVNRKSSECPVNMEDVRKEFG